MSKGSHLFFLITNEIAFLRSVTYVSKKKCRNYFPAHKVTNNYNHNSSVDRTFCLWRDCSYYVSMKRPS